MNPIEEKHFMNNENQREWENKSDAIVHANITKETAMGFNRWMHINCLPTDRMDIWEYYPGEQTILKLTTSELYDIYLKSMKS
jgi:hypothetical protein